MAYPLPLGPSGDLWLYYSDTKSYDLTRNVSAPGYSIATTQGASDTTIILAPSLSALVVVDMQNFFLHPRCNDYPAGLDAADRILEVVKKCRDIGIQIIWLNWGLAEADLLAMPAATQRSFARSLISPPEDNRQARYGFGSDMGSDRGRLLMAGSWNAALFDPLRDASDVDADIFCSKNRISGLWRDDTPLGKVLERNGYRTLLFAGVNTDQCVLGTLADAYNRGFDCVMLDDCCATKTPGGKEVTILNASNLYGFVTDSDSFCGGSTHERVLNSV
ncbi:Isochorismatase hydrolase [Xylariaceae sp. FL1651]|nr:Isochorismatase hydrolase [Xylariaceae sp. FL1651]